VVLGSTHLLLFLRASSRGSSLAFDSVNSSSLLCLISCNTLLCGNRQGAEPQTNFSPQLSTAQYYFLGALCDKPRRTFSSVLSDIWVPPQALQLLQHGMPLMAYERFYLLISSASAIPSYIVSEIYKMVPFTVGYLLGILYTRVIPSRKMRQYHFLNWIYFFYKIHWKANQLCCCFYKT